MARSEETPPSIASPCRKICRLDETRSFCTTCRRTLPEIATWGRMPPEDRARVLARIDTRDDDELRHLATHTQRRGGARARRYSRQIT